MGRCQRIFLRVENIEHGIQGFHQFLCALALFELDCLQLFFGAPVNRHHAAQKHLGYIIACPDPGTMHQAQHQGEPLRFLIIFQLGNIERLGFLSNECFNPRIYRA
jgi:hypothetical protein